MASGNIHIGTMAGKLNGVMPGHHAERLADRVGVHPGGHVLREPALEQVRDAAGELDHLEPAGHLAGRVGGDLAVLGADQLGQLAGVLLSSSRNANRTSARLASDAPRQPGNALAAAATASPTTAAEAKSTVPVTWPVAGS